MNRKQSIRESVLLCFCDEAVGNSYRLADISEKEWSGLLRWMDVSGLALYFLERMRELEWSGCLPAAVLARLEQNLRDNMERTAGLVEESVEVQKEFQGAGVSYATLKGFSLSPRSVPRPELRHQFDLDFLIAEKSAAEARRLLERRGYALYGKSGRSWEFKRDDAPGRIRDWYKNVPCRAVELHVEEQGRGDARLLERVEMQTFHGIEMPVLSPVDLLMGQGLHAYKHIRSEFSRTSHLLEFRRHVMSRCGEDAFWSEVEARVEKNVEAAVGLGVVILLITHVLGDFAPEALRRCTVERLPKTARLWVNLHGARIVFGDTPGSKLYLLLERGLEAEGLKQQRRLREALLPSRWPPPVVRGHAGETLRGRAARYRLQVAFVISRARFHVVEGLRYGRESYRWRRYMNRAIG